MSKALEVLAEIDKRVHSDPVASMMVLQDAAETGNLEYFIHEFLLAAKYNQTAIAEMLGVSRMQVNRYVRGEQEPSWRVIQKMLEVAGKKAVVVDVEREDFSQVAVK